MLEYLGYFGAIFIGLVLGLTGGGGSILAVPVLVYLLQIEPEIATGYSLFIVGITALVGAVAYFRNQLIDLRTALTFGAPSIAGVFLTRYWLVPALPSTLLTIGSFELTKNIGIMLLFAILMLGASYSMIFKHAPESEDEDRPFSPAEKKPEDSAKKRRKRFALIVTEGIVVGVLTGLVGAGGGFLIVPALVFLTGLRMKVAVGTSLLIISMKSLIGFGGDLIGSGFQADWLFLGIFSGIAVAGIFIGSYLAKFVPGKKLKPAFGVFILLLGILIIGREIYGGIG